MTEQHNYSKEKTHVIGRIGHALKEGQDQEAVCTLSKALKESVFHKSMSISDCISQSLGHGALTRLVKAYVRYPCYFCKNGREPCQNCNQRGVTDDIRVCEDCTGLGSIRCNFCNGTGWVGLNDIPADFKFDVLFLRTDYAIENARKLLKQSPCRVRSENAEESRQSNVRQLLEYDRLMGILEDTLITAKKASPSDDQVKNNIIKLACKAVKVAADCEVRRRELLRWMARAAQCEAEQVQQDSISQKAAFAKKDYYQALYQLNSFSETNLEHPFLSEAIRKLLGQSKILSQSVK